MTRNRSFLLAVSASLAALFVTATIAEAQTRGRRAEQARPLTVKKRSFLDAGKVVAVGSESHYVRDQFDLQRPVVTHFAPSRYGAETLPGRFGVFGN